MRKIIFAAGGLAFIAMIRSIFISGIHNNNSLFLFGIAVALCFYGYYYDRLVRLKWLTGGIFAVIFIGIGFAAFLGIYGRRITATFDEEVILVLGAGTRDGEVRSALAQRLDAAMDYHARNPYALIVVSGGVGHRETRSEAWIMAQYLINRGIPEDIIILEDRAYSTYTNMTFSLEVLGRYFDSAPRVVVVTNNFHMYRSVRFARQAGFEATVYPARTPWYVMPFSYAREVAAVIKMWVIGR